MKSRLTGPFLVAAPFAALALAAGAPPAAANVACSQAAHAYATLEISLVDPLKKLQSCIKDRLAKAKDKSDTTASATKVNWQGCRSIAARFASDPETVSTKQFVELDACVAEWIKDFR